MNSAQEGAPHVREHEERDYIHLYTGNGKGKTTAALGLSLRAAGAGKTVFISQFIKGMPYAELEALKRFPEITVRQYGLDCFIVREPTKKDAEAARKGPIQYAPQALYETADLVTDMREVKHYYQAGIQARKGIEY